MTRWLTDTDKAKVLAELDPDELDAEIAGLCGALNELAGVCTLFSCAGHRFEGWSRAEPGYLALWLSEAMSDELDEHVGELIVHDGIVMDKSYRLDDGDVEQWAVIRFAGAGHGSLDTSAERIGTFFTALCAQVGDPARR